MLLTAPVCLNRQLLVAFAVVIALCCVKESPAQSTASLRSPDGRIELEFHTSHAMQPAPAGQLSYSLSFKGKPVLISSALGLELRDEPLLGADVRIVSATPSTSDTTYQLVAGKTRNVRDHYNALRIETTDAGSAGRKLIIEARAYDDAVAFRYVVPEQPGLKEFRLAREKTEFRLPNDATTWALLLPNYRSMYEGEFIKLPATAFSNQGGVKSSMLIGLPLLFELPGVAWVAITEADVRDYAKMYLTNPSGSWTGFWFESRLAAHLDDADISVVGALPHHSAWRTLLVGENPGALIESNVVTSLNPEPTMKDTAWIRPGKASWDWWSGSLGPDGKGAYTTETMKYYVDFAAAAGLEYMLIDAGWSAPRDITKLNGTVDVPEVARYAKTKNVRVWLWAGYEDLDRQTDQAFALFEQWGIAGVKTDFIERDDQAGIEFYYRTAAKAAQHHILMDFHGATTPWGLQRSWPNVLGYEAVLGMEQSKAGARDNPEHHVTLPFTRMLNGIMDYTPGGFENVTREEFRPRMEHPMVMGTRAHQLAMYVVFEAPSQMVSDHPGAYAGQPAFQFIKDVPTTWDETRAINGYPGEFVTIARRAGGNWYLGSMTNWTPRQLEIPLNFLGEGNYTAEIYADAKDANVSPKNVAIEKRSVDRGAKLSLQLAPGGGCAVRFVPVR